MSRVIVYVPGAGLDQAGVSDAWFAAMRPYVDDYGDGLINQTRYEVIWEDIINWTGETNDPLAIMQDFMAYLYNDKTRLAILKRFAEVVQPLLLAGHTVDVISHSEGTIVAYEGLRMVPPGLGAVLNLFTVGTALGYAWNPLVPGSNVRDHLLPGNASGDAPSVVKAWWNVWAQGDPFASPLLPAYPGVTQDFGPMPPVGCGDNQPSCIHESYFDPANTAVNQGIFAAKING
jgi:hypothetical protein